MEEIAEMLGHETGGVTELYAKDALDFMSQAIEAVDAYFTDLKPVAGACSSCLQPRVGRLRYSPDPAKSASY